MNSRVGEDLLHAVAGRPKRIDDLVHRGAIIRVLRIAKADGLEDLLDLALRECVGVAKFLAESLRARPLAGQARIEAQVRVLTDAPVIFPAVVRCPESLREIEIVVEILWLDAARRILDRTRLVILDVRVVVVGKCLCGSRRNCSGTGGCRHPGISKHPGESGPVPASDP